VISCLRTLLRVLRVIARVGKLRRPCLFSVYSPYIEIRLLYPLYFILIIQKVNVGQSFRKGKIISEFSQEHKDTGLF